jgi:hypothetical protein
VDLTGTPTFTARAHKLHAVYADLAHVAELGAGSPIPIAWYRALMGSLEWVAELDASVRLRRFKLRAPLTRAERAGHSFVIVSEAAAATAEALLDRALAGEARAARVLPVDIVAAFSIAVHATGDGGMQATVRADASIDGRRVAAITSDASLNRGVVTAGVLLGEDRAVHMIRPAAPGESSTSAEIAALALVAEDVFVAQHNTVAVWVTDSKVAADLVNAQDARTDRGYSHELEHVLLAAERHGVQLFALWVPRTLNTLTDALTNCRSRAEALECARRHGRRLSPSARED